jgi:hypothetical protein
MDPKIVIFPGLRAAQGGEADLIDELVAALDETLMIARRNEAGDYVQRAVAALMRARKG